MNYSFVADLLKSYIGRAANTSRAKSSQTMALKLISKLAEGTLNILICITDFERLKMNSIPLLQHNKRL